VWCQDVHKPYPKGYETIEDQDDELEIDGKLNRVLRGGSFDDHALSVRSALRDWNLPVSQPFINGIRLARTLPLAPESRRK
jgi:formylglycine-generating enzyme required for sulfatase activity